MLPDEPQICAAVVEFDYAVWFECELLPGHAGDHRATLEWQNEPHGPKPAPVPRPSRLLSEAWAKDIEEALVRSLARRPPGRVL